MQARKNSDKNIEFGVEQEVQTIIPYFTGLVSLTYQILPANYFMG